MKRKHYVALALALLALVAVLRALLTYEDTAQGFDEPCHIAAALEWLDQHTYTLDPVHPPLARVAIGLPLYLAGERFPHLPSADPASHNYNVVGDDIIYGDGRYLRNLSLARSGMLPFLVLAIVLVFFWARRAFGNFAGLAAAALFSTLPIVLAFSGLAYTDLPTACMQFAALFAFATWLEKPTTRSTVLLGITVGLAWLSKLTTLLFLPAAVAAMVVCGWIVSARRQSPSNHDRVRWFRKATTAAAVAILVVWAGYGFSLGHVRESMQLTPETMPSFQHFPGPVRSIARRMIVSDWVLPAPALLKGVATAWALNKTAPQSYLLGNVKTGGWWYFFILALAVKTPLPFLILCLAGAGVLVRCVRQRRWQPLAPAVSAVAILIVTMGVSYDAGLRHVLVVFPLLAVVGGYAAAYFWKLPGKSRIWGRTLLAALFLWQGVSSLQTRNDYIAYFNVLAGRDPSKVLLTGCDLDCGQDLYRLSAVLRSKHIAHVGIAIWSSADLSRMNLPDYEVLQPFHPISGWVAISLRSLRFGDVLHQSYPPDAFAWINQYQPVESVGKTIRLYYIPGDSRFPTVPRPANQPEVALLATQDSQLRPSLSTICLSPLRSTCPTLPNRVAGR